MIMGYGKKQVYQMIRYGKCLVISIIFNVNMVKYFLVKVNFITLNFNILDFDLKYDKNNDLIGDIPMCNC